MNQKRQAAIAACLFWCEPVCKPGSVLNGHLSRPAVAGGFKPPPEDGRAGLASSLGVAPDRVYSIPMLPWRRVSYYLTFPPLLWAVSNDCPERYISVALVRGSPLAGVTRYPCPMEPGLSSRTGFRLVPAAVRPAHGCILIIFGTQVNVFKRIISCHMGRKAI